MTDEELFLKEGADYFGNRLVWRHKDVGIKVPGGALVVTPDGEDVLARLKNIVDVEVKPARKSRKSDAPVEESSNIDALLGE